MHLLLIGGSGFLSGTLARVAVQAGFNVSVVTRGQRPLPAGVTAITADRKDRTSFATAIKAAHAAQGARWDLVVDCIGYDVEDARQDIAIFSPLASHFVFVSTDFVYDPGQRQYPQDEANPHFLTDDSYGARKRLCEQEFINGDAGDMRWSIIRPCHIYGPGSLLGCLPAHGRDPELLNRLREGQPLQLVGGGHFLQQPVLAADLARLILSCAGQPQTNRQIYHGAGPDMIESRHFYGIIADVLEVKMQVEELPVTDYLKAHPESSPFLCHRIYNMRKAQEHGLALPSTPIEAGLRQHVASLL